MNKAQRVVVVITLALVVGTGLLPPYRAGQYYRLGRAFIFGPPPVHSSGWHPWLDFPRLGFEWLLIVVAGVAAYIAVGRRKPGRDET